MNPQGCLEVRSIVRGLLLVAAGVAVAWWGWGAAADDGPVVVRYRARSALVAKEFRDAETSLVEQFLENNPGVVVQYEEAAADPKLGLRKLVREFDRGKAPDVFAVDDVAGFCARGMLLNLEKYVVRDADRVDLDECYPLAVDYTRFDGTVTGRGDLYGLPAFGMVTFALYYNRDLFDEAELEYPDETWTWTEFVEAAKKLTRDTDGDGFSDQYGCADLVLSGVGYQPVLWSFGASYLDESMTKPAVGTEEFRDAFRFVHDLYWKHRVIGSPTDDRGQPDLVMSFAGGRFAMMVASCGLAPELRRFGSSLEWDVAPVPKGPAGRATPFASYNLGINSKTNHPEAAWELLQFLTSTETVGKRAYAQVIRTTPPRRPIAGSWIYLGVSPPKHAQVFVDAVQYGRIDPSARFDGGPEISRAIQTELVPFLQNEMPLDEAVANAQRKGSELFGERESNSGGGD